MASDLLETLRLCASDPMWANHVEMTKKLLTRAIARMESDADRIDSLTARVKALEAENEKLQRTVRQGASIASSFLRHFNPNNLPEDSSMQWQQLEHWIKHAARAALENKP